MIDRERREQNAQVCVNYREEAGGARGAEARRGRDRWAGPGEGTGVAARSQGCWGENGIRDQSISALGKWRPLPCFVEGLLGLRPRRLIKLVAVGGWSMAAPAAERLCPQAQWGPRQLLRAAAAKISPPCCLHLTLSHSRHAGPGQRRSSEAHLLGLKQELWRSLVLRRQIPSRSRSSAIWSPGLPIQLNQTG